ncbi:MAG: hypothetical protein ABR511_12735, partial [Acidimicrobiales bacterium]
MGLLRRLDELDRRVGSLCGSATGAADVRPAMSETFKTGREWLATVATMNLRPALIELVVSDMAATLAF